jgi:putative transposase
MRERFSETQILEFLRTAAAGTPVMELCWNHCFRRSTFRAWKAKYGGEIADGVRQLEELERERGVDKRPSRQLGVEWSYILLRYSPPTSNKAFVICPSEHTRTVFISSAKTFPSSITVCCSFASAAGAAFALRA